jgi:excinuclease UvrABC helicase subunit UvrB
MSRFSPLDFQKEAIQKLTDAFQRLWQRSEPQRHLVFKSPTGSGKTFMVTNFLHGLQSICLGCMLFHSHRMCFVRGYSLMLCNLLLRFDV